MRRCNLTNRLMLIAGVWTVMLAGCGVQVVPKGTDPVENADYEIIQTPDSEPVVLTVAD